MGGNAEVSYGNASGCGPGVFIVLDADALASAIDLWLYSQDVIVRGPRTVRIDGRLCSNGRATVYVDPSGFVIKDGIKFNGDAWKLEQITQNIFDEGSSDGNEGNGV